MRISGFKKRVAKRRVSRRYHVHGEGDGEVEGVVGGLVADDEGVLLNGETGEIDIILGSGDQVQELAQLGLVGGLVEELNQLNVVGILLEVLLEEEVDGRLEDERVVDGDHSNTALFFMSSKIRCERVSEWDDYLITGRV